MREDAKARRGSSMYIKTSVCVVGGGRDEKKRYDHCVTDRRMDGRTTKNIYEWFIDPHERVNRPRGRLCSKGGGS